VLIDLRTHVLSGRKVQDLVRDALHGAGVKLTDGDLDFLIGKGGFLILVDSLNELPDPDDLSRMRAVGHVSLTGTLGYDCSFIRLIQTPTGRKIRFVTNRQLRFGEVWTDSQSQAFNLTAGEIDLNDQDKNKSTGVLYPAAQLVIDKQGQLQIDLNQNAWKLVDVLDWKGTAGVN
jgi:hypothetical protein